MGVVNNITYNTFPKQSDWIGKEVEVFFHYDISSMIKGIIVRDDKEAPWITLIKIDDKYVLGTECQFKPPFN